MHTSQFSMGVDVADANNDGYPEVITVDMLPDDPYILKRSEGEDTYDIFNLKLGYGYNNQYTRNNLQLNRRNGMLVKSVCILVYMRQTGPGHLYGLTIITTD